MIRPIYNPAVWFLHKVDLAKEQKEQEDSDLNVVEEVQEQAPLCPNIEEIVDWIINQLVIRDIKYLFIHCTATHQSATVSAILNYWKNTLGWKGVGYHGIILPDGKVSILADFNTITNGVRGYNSNSIHFSYMGGIDVNGKAFDNRTEEQKRVLKAIVKAVREKVPSIQIKGHNEVSSKACPSFDVQKWLDEIK